MKTNHLGELSPIHEHELKACQLIRKGINRETDLHIMKNFTRNFWNEQLHQHVDSEEKVLVPWLRKNDKLRHYSFIIHNDHTLIESIFSRSQNDYLSYRILELFAESLEEHIAFEEQVVFKAIKPMPNHQEMETFLFANPVHNNFNSYGPAFWQ